MKGGEKKSNLIQVLHTENKSTPSTRTNEMDSFAGRRLIRSGRIRWEWCLDEGTGLEREGNIVDSRWIPMDYFFKPERSKCLLRLLRSHRGQKQCDACRTAEDSFPGLPCWISYLSSHYWNHSGDFLTHLNRETM